MKPKLYCKTVDNLARTVMPSSQRKLISNNPCGCKISAYICGRLAKKGSQRASQKQKKSEKNKIFLCGFDRWSIFAARFKREAGNNCKLQIFEREA